MQHTPRSVVKKLNLGFINKLGVEPPIVIDRDTPSSFLMVVSCRLSVGLVNSKPL